MASDLALRECVPCRGGVPPLKGPELAALGAQLPAGWEVVGEHHLEKSFQFGTYADGVAFANRVAGLAERQNHHPELLVAYRRVRVSVWTHKIDGLTESDFVFAAKADALS